MANKRVISVYEHESLKFSNDSSEKSLTREQLEALQGFYKEKDFPYYSLINKGVRFCEYVGVIQVGSLVIEVLPKADKIGSGDESTKYWRDILIKMLKATGYFDVRAPSSSSLSLKSNHLLDLYFELFVKEVEYLYHCGLIKKYRKTEGNTTALKGSLQFGKHINQNLTHQERFYVRYTTYDTEHTLHFILYKTLRLLNRLNTNNILQSWIGALLLNFPEMPDIKVTEATFNKLVFDRKSERYREAVNIAKLLLLNYHPDVKTGQNNVLALMFDMNRLWEKFIYVCLRKHLSGFEVKDQVVTEFWLKDDSKQATIVKPDIVITKGDKRFVLDTKWKNLNGKNPSADDLQQMFTYQHLLQTEKVTLEKVALLYPSVSMNEIFGKFVCNQKPCDVLSVDVDVNISEWQKKNQQKD